MVVRTPLEVHRTEVIDVRSLVIYPSRSRTTRKIAETIASRLKSQGTARLPVVDDRPALALDGPEHAAKWIASLAGNTETGAPDVVGEAVGRRGARIALFAADAFVAVTASGGGIALITGLEGDRFPLDLLKGTPFNSYAIPGLILSAVVGGSATAASIATLRSPRTGALASMLAGVVLIGWLAGERLILPSRAFSSQSRWVEAVYSAAGLLMAALALIVRQSE